MANPETKKNVRRFLEALLTYTSPESQGVYEERLKIKSHWEEPTGRLYPLVVRTTLKELEKLVPSDLTDGKLSQNQIRHVIQKYLSEKFLGILKDNREQPKGSKYWHFTLTLWSKDTSKNLEQFDQEWERRLLKLPSPNSRNQPKGDIDWQQLCRKYLQLQRSLASNLFSAPMGISFDLDELHVPLGLVERQQKSQRWEDFDPEWGSRVYQEEKSIPIDYDDFFDRVLAQGQSPKSEGSRLAIIGEPGAGKTVLLLKVGEWVLNQAVGLPIWISLGAVGNKPLDQYLTEDWLRLALGKAGLMSVHVEAACKFEQLLNQGQVWLLLDGADEMSVSDPLGTLADQLRVPLLQNVRVVLTCRVNLWDAPINALDEFDTYKMLDFSFGDGNKPNQVKLFIDNWFSSSNSSNGLRLWQQLNQTGMTRIKDLARNPLRLALLCLIWAGKQETLPKTKAQLYKLFVEALYRLKQKVFPTTLRERTDKNAALGKLALQALILGYKSVLPTALVEKELNQGELFEKALELGWLNRVGVEPQNILNSVYAFFHPTFLEYFAASAIGDNRHLFLHHIQENPLDPSACYRIFEPQWQEVFLLWLGREDVAPSSKEALLQALIKFEDGCLGLYKFRAYLLAAAGIAEFSSLSESQVADQIVFNLSKWAFSEFYGSKIEVFNVEQPQLFNVLQI